MAQPETAEAARDALRLTFLHWGLHGWGVYAVVGLALAYFCFRHDLPLSFRSALYPLIGDRVRGRVGDLIDVFAVLGTMFGVATSLGLGAQQVAAGIEHLTGVSTGVGVQIGIIAAITAAATASVVAGLDRGIKRLSDVNMLLALTVLVLVLVAGPTALALSGTLQAVGDYLQTLPEQALHGAVFGSGDGSEWLGTWTLFYWGWWLAWCPFVGVFIARISRGRTVREFVFGVLLVPSVVTMIWFGIFGSMGLDQVLNGGTGLGAAVQDNFPVAIFVFLESFPLPSVLSVAAMVVVVLFFVTSSDSASLVIDMLTAGGDTDPPKPQRVFWATTEGLVGAVLLLTGGLSTMQTFQLTTGVPLAVIVLLMLVAVVRAMRADLDGRDLRSVAEWSRLATAAEEERELASIDSW